MKIGVFDSGVGGMSVAKAVMQAFPGHEVILREDRDNLPYGTKTPDELFQLVKPILDGMVKDGCKVVVIACNSVSTTILNKLRENIHVQLIGVEPMISEAAHTTQSKIIAVCATPTTLASDRYAKLKTEYAANMQVLEPDCSDWAKMIEHNQIDESKIADRIGSVLANGADVIVLGCTHYHWIESEVIELAKGKAKILQPEQKIIDELRSVLARLT